MIITHWLIQCSYFSTCRFGLIKCEAPTYRNRDTLSRTKYISFTMWILFEMELLLLYNQSEKFPFWSIDSSSRYKHPDPLHLQMKERYGLSGVTKLKRLTYSCDLRAKLPPGPSDSHTVVWLKYGMPTSWLVVLPIASCPKIPSTIVTNGMNL